MIKVLIVDDSPSVREFLTYLFESTGKFLVVGTAVDGEEALEAVSRLKPDIITMDVHMPKLNGYQATRRIMETCPTPIVIVSNSIEHDEVSKSFQAMEAGALAVLQKPVGFGHPDQRRAAAELIKEATVMSEVRLVRRWRHKKADDELPRNVPTAREGVFLQSPGEIKIIAIGASTGGPPALKIILSALPNDLSVPLLIVQHIATGFAQGLVEWLAQSSGFPVYLAETGQQALPGCAYIAPDGFHLGVTSSKQIVLHPSEPENGLRPAVSFLFRSVASVFGRQACGVILTGMGRDGAAELKQLKEKGAVTIAQNKESSVVHGMPGEAIEMGAATYVLAPADIAAALVSLSKTGSVSW
jgi:two-component system chemotaxis response regulator CheB